MNSPVHHKVTNQFSPAAASYATSSAHANGEELRMLVDQVDPQSTDLVIDVACGAGHMGLALAPRVSRVTAYDLTLSMLDQTLSTARERGLDNVVAVQGPAEDLPFEDQSFDIYAVRLAPHHFADVPLFLAEAYRVLRPGGKLLIVDTTSPEDDLLDATLNQMELIRDPSHVRNYRLSEWRSMIEGAGFEISEIRAGRCGELEFGYWTRRQNVTEDRVERLRKIFAGAEPRFGDLIQLEDDGGTYRFTLPQATIHAFKTAIAA